MNYKKLFLSLLFIGIFLSSNTIYCNGNPDKYSLGINTDSEYVWEVKSINETFIKKFFGPASLKNSYYQLGSKMKIIVRNMEETRNKEWLISYDLWPFTRYDFDTKPSFEGEYAKLSKDPYKYKESYASLFYPLEFFYPLPIHDYVYYALAQKKGYSITGNISTETKWEDSEIDVGNFWSPSVAISSDGRYIVSGSRNYGGDPDHGLPSLPSQIKVWELATGSELYTLNCSKNSVVQSVAISPDGRYIVSGSNDKNIKIWEFATGKLLRTIHLSDGVNSVAISPDGRYIVSGAGSVGVWELATGRNLSTLNQTPPVYSVAISPNGFYFASGAWNSTNVWDLYTRSELFTINQTSPVYSVAFSPDGRYIASGLDDGTINIWDLDTETSLCTLKRHKDQLTSVAFFPDGHYIASGSLDGTVKVWELATRRVLNTLDPFIYTTLAAKHGYGTGEAGVNSLAISPLGRYIVVGLTPLYEDIYYRGYPLEIIVFDVLTGKDLEITFNYGAYKSKYIYNGDTGLLSTCQYTLSNNSMFYEFGLKNITFNLQVPIFVGTISSIATIFVLIINIFFEKKKKPNKIDKSIN